MPKIYDNLLIIGGQNQIPLIVYTQSTSNPILYLAENGNVGIGLTPSYYRLEVSGTVSTVGLRMPTGASAGYIIKSDTLGNASWQRSEYDTMPDADDKTIEISLSNEIRLKQTVDVAYNSVGNIVARHFNGAIEQGYNTNATGTSSHASGYGSTASGITSFIHSYNSSVSGDRSVVLGGQNINGTQSDTVYVPNINIVNISTVSTSDNLLVRSSDGMIKSISPSQLISNMSGVTGSGTTNYISKFTSSTSIGNSLIFDDGTGVGIGTTSPISKLDIETSTGYGLVTKITGPGGVALTARSEDSGSTPFNCQAGSTVLMTVLYNGNVGVGISNPSTALDVNKSKAVVSIRDTDGVNKSYFGAYEDYLQLSVNRNPSTGLFYTISKSSSQISLYGGNSDSKIIFYTIDSNNTIPTERMVIDKLGNVGIGSSSPTEKLDVNGKTKTTNLQINTGSVSSGYVLTSSDTSGNSLWKQIGTASGIGSVNKYSTTVLNINIVINTPITITHNLITTDITVTVWDIYLNEMTLPKISNRTTNSIDITFTSKPSGDIRIVIMA